MMTGGQLQETDFVTHTAKMYSVKISVKQV
jgi:hypothetical protein